VKSVLHHFDFVDPIFSAIEDGSSSLKMLLGKKMEFVRHCFIAVYTQVKHGRQLRATAAAAAATAAASRKGASVTLTFCDGPGTGTGTDTDSGLSLVLVLVLTLACHASSPLALVMRGLLLDTLTATH
jgi:hypothetical protein